MKKVIRETDEKRGIVQITVADERWYTKPGKDPASGIPVYTPVPSVTWIAGFWPKGVGFYKWLADKGWDEAEAAKQAAGDKGSRVHLAIERILRGEEFRIDTKVEDKSRSTEEIAALTELSYEELLCVKSFIDWRNEVKPEIIANEITVFSEIHGYAGTVDLICRIDGVPYVIDFKTSKNVWKEYELQVSAYRQALENGENPIYERNENGTETSKLVDLSGLKTAILQVGYERNKAGYKFTEIEDAFPLFTVAQQIWKAEIGDNTPGFTKRDFPIVLSPGKSKESASAEKDVAAANEAIGVATNDEPAPRKRASKKR
ncbi:MAG: PD-(D/E)XK nuclease family protein [Alphaproteobacteria bacterium]|nr:PD-(D/E)XK nuclease family protein [Alphaproteobacteria bacterium]MCW5741580.1 PD-(D/E)XK nuclease family protein [Alphaproteobacteria bacterium]